MKENTATVTQVPEASKVNILGVALCTSAGNLYNILFAFASYLATGSWGIAVATAGALIAGMRIFDAITDPIYTWFLPRIRFGKIGIAQPQIVLGWLLETVSIACLFIFLPASQNRALFILFYGIHVIGYTIIVKASTLMKLMVTTNPKKRPLIARYNQSIIMIVTMVLSLLRANYLVPKYHGLKGGFFTELSAWILIWCTISVFVGILLSRKFDNRETFERNYHGAVNFKLKDIWNLIAHNPAFITEIISQATDKIASATAGNSAVTTMLFGIIIANPKFANVRSLEGVAPTKNPSMPIFAVPTTAGTAAEVTINYVITDVQKHRKFVCVDPHDIPVVAFVDPDMMSTMPQGLTAFTGMDALTHAIEGYITKGACAMTDFMHLEAIRLISLHLRDAVANKPSGREGMALGQYIAGMGFSNVGLGVDHSMAHGLSALYDMPHGKACAILLPTVLKFNAPATGNRYRAVATAMGVKDVEKMTLAQARKAAIAAVEQLAKDVGIPPNLKGVLKEEDIQFLAESAYADACRPGNPRDCTVEEIAKLYRSLM